jgi:integrase
MFGTKRFKDGAWRLAVYDRRTKKTVNTTVRAPNTRAGAKEADLALLKQVAKVEGGVHDGGMTVAELFDRWLRVKAPTWSPKTVDTNTQGVRHLAAHLGHYKISELRPTHIEDCYEQFQTIMAMSTVHRIHNTLHNALEQARRWDLIATNPAGRVTPPRVERRKNTTPDPDQLLRLFAAVQVQPDLAAFTQLASTTGARRGTVAALRWSNVDLERGTVIYVNKFTTTNRGQVEMVGSKTGRLYQVTIGLDVNAALRRWRIVQKERAIALGTSMPDDPWVFTSPLDPTQPRPLFHWTREWRRLTQAVDPTGGLDHVRLHDLKHYAATQLLANGVPVLQVAERLAMSPALLMSLYGHAIPANDRELADVFDRLHRPG